MSLVLTTLQWQYGRRGQDGWAKWTRRRKWYRDAELVEVDLSDPPQPEEPQSPKPTQTHKKGYSTTGEKMVPMRAESSLTPGDQPGTDDDGASIVSTSSKSSFWPQSLRRRPADNRPPSSTERNRPRGSSVSEKVLDDDASGLGRETELELQNQGRDGGRWGIGDEAHMNLE